MSSLSNKDELKERIREDLLSEVEGSLCERFKKMLIHDIYIEPLVKYEGDICIDSEVHLEVIKDICSKYDFSLIHVNNKYYICNDLKPDSAKVSEYLISRLNNDEFIIIFGITALCLSLGVGILSINKFISLVISVVYLIIMSFFSISFLKEHRLYRALDLVDNNSLFISKS